MWCLRWGGDLSRHMVLLHQKGFSELYDRIKLAVRPTFGSQATTKSVDIFVAMNTDALCACRMLTVTMQLLTQLPTVFHNRTNWCVSTRAGAVQV